MPHTVPFGAFVDPQLPPVQVATVQIVEGHTLPQAPQFVRLVLVSTQKLPQLVCPVGQLLQVPAEQIWPAPHALLHEPQKFGLLLVSAQVLPQATCVPPSDLHISVAASQQPLMQSELTRHCLKRPHGAQLGPPQSTSVSRPSLILSVHVEHLPETQVSPATGQTALQEPQLFGSVWRFTQAPEQLVKPELQMIVHCPLEQMPRPLVGGGQTLPQAPQLLTSLARFTQFEPHRVWPAGQRCAAAHLQTHCSLTSRLLI
jgi:hypothetical protein